MRASAKSGTAEAPRAQCEPTKPAALMRASAKSGTAEALRQPPMIALRSASQQLTACAAALQDGAHRRGGQHCRARQQGPAEDPEDGSGLCHARHLRLRHLQRGLRARRWDLQHQYLMSDLPFQHAWRSTLQYALLKSRLRVPAASRKRSQKVDSIPRGQD